MSTAAYQRAYRARKSGRAGVNGRPPTQPCGTHAAYRRHRARGEDACAACRKANAEHSAKYRKGKSA